jgi:hypothetical protein
VTETIGAAKAVDAGKERNRIFMRWILTAVLFLGLSVDTERAQAFEAWRFKNGMTQEQAIAVADQQGYELPHPKDPSTVGFQKLTFVPKGSRAPDGSFSRNDGYELAFCGGHLVAVSREYKPTMSNLMVILDSLSRQYGTPTVEASPELLIPGPVNSMEFEFRETPDDNVSIWIDLSPNSETEFNIQVTHQVIFQCEYKPH